MNTNSSPTTELAPSWRRAHGLVKTFGDLRAVDGIDLEVRRGEVFGVLGPNGAGKTTMLQMLATLLPMDGGSAQIFGVDVKQHPHVVRQLVGVTGQYASVDENLTARENLYLFGRLLGLLRQEEAAPTAEELLGRFGLEDAGDKQISQFSGGMRRRLDLAASLISQPPLIFLDEPTTGLDPRTRGQMWETIRDLVAQGCTVLLTTQYLDEADQLADRIAVIDRGVKVAEGTSDQLKSQVGSSTLQLRLLDPAQTAQAVDVVRRVVGDEPVLTPEAGGINVPLPDANRAADVLIGAARAGAAHHLRDRAEAHPRRGVHGLDRPRAPRSPTPRPDPEGAGPMTPALPHGRRDRHRHHPVGAQDLPARPSARDTVSQSLAMAWRATKKMRRNPEQFFDVTIQPLLFTAMFAYIFGGAISGSVAGLPADHHPGHPRPDRADRLHGDRHPAPRGHGQGRLRPVQVAADRADRAAGRPGDRRPAALRDRVDPDDPHRASRWATAPAAGSPACSPAGCSRSSRAGRWPGSSPGSAPIGPQRPGGAGHLDDDHVPADLPVQRVRPGRHPAAAGSRPS